MTQCQTPQESANFVSSIVDRMVREYLLSGVIQAGLSACGSESYLSRDSEVVVCDRLYAMVQAGLDDGSLTYPTIINAVTTAATLTLGRSDGTTLAVDLADAISAQITTHLKDCSGTGLTVGQRIATCAELNNVDERLSDALDHLGDTLTQQMSTMESSLRASMYEKLIEVIEAHRTVYHDESLEGDGHESAILQVNQTWLTNYIDEYFNELDLFKDCDNAPLPLGAKVVTSECLSAVTSALTSDLESYIDYRINIAMNSVREEAIDREDLIVATITALRDRVDDLEQRVEALEP